ncbi:MAG: energy-coupled thiamine transporter ThiT [Lachnospiraceae bacterium]|nr:energy-coupled thiamine transporter ThiT [Lachnospiraceae bacterium]
MRIFFTKDKEDRDGGTEQRTAQMRENFRDFWWGHPKRWFALLLAVSLLLSYVHVFRMGEGGEVTFLSMMMLAMIGYILGPRYGILGALLFALIKYTIDYIFPGYFLTVLQEYLGQTLKIRLLVSELTTEGYRALKPDMMLGGHVDRIQVAGDLFDYLFGYVLVGLYGWLEGLRYKKKGKVYRVLPHPQYAFLIVIVLRFIESVINYGIFYPEPKMPGMEFFGEAVKYSLFYVGLDGLIAYIVLTLPQVTNVMTYLRMVANNAYDYSIYEDL